MMPSAGIMAASWLELVDGGVHPRLDLEARQAGLYGREEAHGDDAGTLDELAARPEPAGIHRNRHDRQLQRTVEAGKAGLERRCLAGGDARPFREDHDRPPLR